MTLEIFYCIVKSMKIAEARYIMKKVLLLLGMLVLSFIIFSNSAAADEKGSRTNPFSAYDENSITLQRYDFDTPKKIKIQLLDLSFGGPVDSIIESENMFNRKPAYDEQWSLFKYKITYVSSPKDEVLDLSDVIAYYADDFYFDKNFRSVPPIDIATLGDLYDSQNVMNLSIYPGSNTLAYTAALFKKNNQYPYFLIKRANGSYYWFSTDPSYKPKANSSINLSAIILSAKMNGNSPTYTGKSVKPNVSIYAGQKKLKQNVDYKLKFADNIDVGYGKILVEGIGKYTGKKSFTFAIKPQKTTIYSISNNKKKSINVSWDYVVGAKNYKVFYKTGSKMKSLKTTKTSATIKGLTKNKTYKVYIVSYYDSKVYSANSNTKSIKIKK